MSSLSELIGWLKAVGDFRRELDIPNEDVTTESRNVDQNLLLNLSEVQIGSEWQSIKLSLSDDDYFDGYVREKEGKKECDGIKVQIRNGLAAIKTTGFWLDGCLEGEAREETPFEPGWTQPLYRRGVLHGIKRSFGISGKLMLIVSYHNGQPQGPLWKGQIGGGYLIGTPDKDDTLCVTGENSLYLFPDLKTAIVGDFRKDRLLSGHMADVIDVLFECGMALPVVRHREGGRVIYRDVSTNKCISTLPLTPDEWEATRVRVSQSALGLNAGEGLFAVQNFLPGDFLALFNGVRLQSSKEDDLTDYKIRLNVRS